MQQNGCDVCKADFDKVKGVLFYTTIEIFLFFLHFSLTGQLEIWQEVSGRERDVGVGMGKVHEVGFDLGTPEAQLHHWKF